MTLDSGARLGPYEIVGPLGSGGMGEVYRARDARLERLVAVKVLPAGSSPQALERFVREAKAIAALNHPGICAVYDVGTAPAPYLVMELLEGQTLHQRLAGGALDIPQIIETALVLADALATAHGKGIVHRDLKPANIILTPRGPKILDFGLARMAESASLDEDVSGQPTLPTQAPLTDHGVAVGTPAYMSPEQLRGEATDARTDLFSLGLVLYEMATGRRAFAGATSAVVSAAILHEEPSAPREVRPDIPARLDDVILALLEKDREIRTQSAAELRAELTRLKRELGPTRGSDTAARATSVPAASASGASVAAVPSAPAPPSSSDTQLMASLVRRHRGVVAAAALVLVAVVGAAYLMAPRGDDGTSASDGAALSIADLKVEVLTASGTARTPAISPDGKYVVYIETGGGRDSLRVRQVATDSNVEIVPGEAGVTLLGATVTLDGAFVNYVRVGAGRPPELWQIPFLGGSPRRHLPGMGGRVGFSPDGRQMAYVRGGGRNQTELVVAPIDGSSERVVATRRLPDSFTAVIVQQSQAPAWSPDGETLAALGGRNGDPSSGQVVFVNVRTGAERAVVVSSSVAPGAGLTGLDGRTLLLSVLDRSSAPLQLWLLSYPDGSLRRLTNDTDQYVSPSATADRSAVVVARTEASFGIWTSDVAATQWTQSVPTTPVKGPIGFRMRWSGDDLVYMSSFAVTRRRALTGNIEVLAAGGGNHTVSRDGSTMVFFDYDRAELSKSDGDGRRRTVLRRGFSPANGGRLSPDGRFLAFVDPTAPKGPTVLLQSMDDPAQVREVTADRVRGGQAEISPDGRWIAFQSVDDQKRPGISVCELAACATRRTIPALPAWRWMPDGQALMFSDRQTQSDLWVQPLDGSAPRQLTHFAPDGQQIWDFDWSADGKRLAVARARITSDIVLFRGLKPTTP